MEVDKTLSVPANQTGEVGYLKAMLGHVSFSSVKVSLEAFMCLCFGGLSVLPCTLHSLRSCLFHSF